MKNGKLSIGLIGAGRAGMIHARNLRASVPHAALTAVADPVEAAARAASSTISQWYLVGVTTTTASTRSSLSASQ